MVTVGSNTLCERAVQEGVVVSMRLYGTEVAVFARNSNEEPRTTTKRLESDVFAHMTPDGKTVRAEGITLAGQLFVALLAAGG